jgi:chaperonin GroES
MKLKPLHDWALIVPAQAAAMTAGGLYIPDSAKEKPEEGVVEAIGPGAYEEEKPGKKKDEKKERKFIPTTVKPGDRVLYERWAGRTHRIGDEERVLVRERDILGLIDRPLQIPAVTTAISTTEITERRVSVPAKSAGQKVLATSLKAKAGKATAKSSAKKSAKKAVKKTAKKNPKKAVKKSAARPSKARPAKSRKAGKKK